MTNTDTADADATAIQVARLAHAGSQLVRITVNTEAAAAAVPEIARKLADLGVGVPIIGDFHYNGHQLLVEYPEMARSPRQVPDQPGQRRRQAPRRALRDDRPGRDRQRQAGPDRRQLGLARPGAADRADGRQRASAAPRDSRDVMIEAMIESAMRSAELAEATGLGHDRIIISAKVSQVRDLVDVYRLLAARSRLPAPPRPHRGGHGRRRASSRSTAGLAILLDEGIGDTIRVSLTPAPGGDRTEEVEIAQQVLQSMGLRSFLPQVSACPGCGRTTSTFFQEMAQQIQDYLRERMPEWEEIHPGVEEMRVAVMGCVVNGPGESKHADIGISLPGTFEEPVAPVFVDGKLDRTLRGEGLVDEFIGILEDYVERRYPATGVRPTGAPRRPPGNVRARRVAVAVWSPRDGRVLNAPRPCSSRRDLRWARRDPNGLGSRSATPRAGCGPGAIGSELRCRPASGGSNALGRSER